MEVPITQFRREIFSLANQALEGGEVWIKHKGRRLKLVPEGRPPSRLSRITPMEIVMPGVDLLDDSWKEEIMREWEDDWDRQLAPSSLSQRKTPAPIRVKARRARRKV